MSTKCFSIRFYPVVWLVIVASLSVWSNLVFAGCSDVVPNGLVACYPFDGNANDASGNSLNGQTFSVALTKDRFGNSNAAYEFYGNTDSYIEVQDHPLLDFKDSFSFSLWIKQTAAQPRGYRLIDKITVGTGDGYLLDTYDGVTGRKMRVITSTWNQSQTTYSLNEWHHLVFTLSNGIYRFYLDGVLSDTGHGGSAPANNLTLRFGKAHSDQNGGFLENFVGLMDDIHIYNRSLSENEVLQLYRGANHTCLPATYTNGVLQVPAIQIEDITDSYKATLQQYSSSFGFQVTQSAIVTGKKSSCPATYSTKTGIGVLHIPLVKTKTTLPPNTPQCYDVTLQEFSNRFQLDLEQVKLTPCP